MGGGGGAAGELGAAPGVVCVLPAGAYCSATGNSGAGATTCECPMLMSPKLRCEAASKLGGGLTIAACGPRRLREDSPVTSPVGATPVCDKVGPCLRFVVILSPAAAPPPTAHA